MFHKLHVQFTIFCSIITGGIVLLLTIICLFFAENSMQNNNFASFLRQLNSVLIHLQEQNTISHQWLGQIQKNGHIMLYLYDNQKPLYYQGFHASQEEDALKEEVIEAARTRHQMDIFCGRTKRIIEHTEFSFSSSSGEKYYVSAGTIPKGSQYMSFLILYPLAEQQAEISRLRLMVCLAVLAALFLLLLFSWFFTGRMLVPLEDSRRKQMHFIAAASHELRAPLAVLQSGLEVLQKTDSKREQKRCVKYMEEESSRMQDLIRDLLLLANADSGHLSLQRKLCQPEELLLSAFEKYQPVAGKKEIAMSVSLPEDCIPDCSCDPQKITQVFSILLDNAISYTPCGGKISLSLVQKKNRLCFGFSDTGPGVPDREKEQIFDRFYRADQAHTDKSHFGLGLCIAKEIVQEHQGKLRVEDAKGGGSRFIVELPICGENMR